MNEITPPPLPKTRSSNWFKRNWKWLVPIAAVVMLALFATSVSHPSPQQAVLRPGQDATLALDNGTTFELVWIEPLKMWMGKYEITVYQYNQLSPFNRDRNGDSGRGQSDDPVTMVNHGRSVSFCRKLTRTFSKFLPSGYVVRLPYDAEWEVCAQCGDTRLYPWGNEWPPTASFPTSKGSNSQSG